MDFLCQVECSARAGKDGLKEKHCMPRGECRDFFSMRVFKGGNTGKAPFFIKVVVTILLKRVCFPGGGGLKRCSDPVWPEKEVGMIMKCLACRQEMNFHPTSLLRDGGRVKCFACGAMMKVSSEQEGVPSVDLPGRGPVFKQDQADWHGTRHSRAPAAPAPSSTGKNRPWRHGR